MADYAHSLNKDTVNSLFTSAKYDSDNSLWMHDSALWHKNAAGILVATGAVDPLPVSVSGSILSQAIIAPVTVNAGATSADSTVLDYHAKYPKQLLLSIAGTFATTSAATGLRLQLFYSPDGVTYDTDAYATIEPTFTASSAVAQTKQKTRPVMVGAGYYKCNVVNLDASVNATAVKVTASEVV